MHSPPETAAPLRIDGAELRLVRLPLLRQYAPSDCGSEAIW